MNWKIQKARKTDAQAIARFQLEMALESEGLVLDEATVASGVSAALEDPAKGLYFVARGENDTVIGSLFLTKEWSDWHNSEYWWIQSVYVRPEYRRIGVFSSLYSYVQKTALSESVTSLRLYVDRDNRNAQQCYHSLGMDECHYLMYEETLSE